MEENKITEKELIQKVIEYLFKKFSDNQVTEGDVELFEIIMQ